MKPNPSYTNLEPSFWATVRSISQKLGYTVRGKDEIKIPTADEIYSAFIDLELNPESIKKGEQPTELATSLGEYFSYRAKTLNSFVQPRLMDIKRVKVEFNKLKKSLKQKNSCKSPP